MRPIPEDGGTIGRFRPARIRRVRPLVRQRPREPMTTSPCPETPAGESGDPSSEFEPEQTPVWVQRLGLVGGPALAALAVVATHPSALGAAGLTADASWTLGLLALMAGWWITLAVDPAVTALVPILWLAALGLGTPAEIASPYADQVIFLFGGGALIGLALDATGVSARFAAILVRLAGSRPFPILAAIMTASAILSAFVSNLATTATLLPLALALGARARAAAPPESRAAAGRFATSLLLGVAFGSSIGGAATVIGSPPNPIAVDWLAKNGVEMDFVRWLRFSVPTTAVFLPLAVAIIGLWLFPAKGVRVPRAEGAAPSLGRDAWLALGVFLLAVALWVTRPFWKGDLPAVRDGTIAILAAFLLFLIPSAERPRQAILCPRAFMRVPWRVLVLFGGGLCLAAAMERTGLSDELARIISAAGALPSIGLLLVVVSLLVFASEVASNTALAAMAVPIVGALAPGLGVAPEALVIPAVFAASWAFAMPVGTPPNALVFASGHLRPQDMMRAGLVLDLVAIVVIVAMSALLL